MNKAIPVVGFLILTAIVLSVFGFATYEAWILQPVVGIVVTLVLLGLLYTLVKEAQTLSKVTAENLFSQKNLLNFVAVFVGAALSYTLSLSLGLGAVLAAGLVGLVGAILLPDYAVPIYTGSFVGMASKTLLPNYGHLAAAGVLAGIIYVLTLSVFGGFGGKLGTIAASGCVIAGLCLPGDFTHPAVPGWNVGWPLVVTSIVAAMITYYLNNTRKHGAVIASSVVGIAAGLLLPALNPEVGKTLAVMAICASFIGMSNTKRFPTIVPMLFAGFVAALAYIYSSPFIGGTGGKLGTMAFGSGLAVRGIMDAIGKLGVGKKE